jgi:hypothetical protein
LKLGKDGEEAIRNYAKTHDEEDMKKQYCIFETSEAGIKRFVGISSESNTYQSLTKKMHSYKQKSPAKISERKQQSIEQPGKATKNIIHVTFENPNPEKSYISPSLLEEEILERSSQLEKSISNKEIRTTKKRREFPNHPQQKDLKRVKMNDFGHNETLLEKQFPHKEFIIYVDLEKRLRQFVEDEAENVKISDKSERKEHKNPIMRRLDKFSNQYEMSIGKIQLLFGKVSEDPAILEAYLAKRDPNLLWEPYEDEILLMNDKLEMNSLRQKKGNKNLDRRRSYLLKLFED